MCPTQWHAFLCTCLDNVLTCLNTILDISVWCQWCLSMAPLPSLGWNLKMRWNMTYPVIWCHKYQMVMSHDAKYIINSITLFIRWRKLKQGVMWLFGHEMLLALVLASYQTDGIINATILFTWSRCFKQDATWVFGHVLLMLASHNNDDIINSTATFVSSKSSK